MTASADKSARVWDVDDGRELLCIALPTKPVSVAFAPYGERIAIAGKAYAGDDSVTSVWEARALGGAL